MSIVITVYNGESQIGGCLESLLSQTYGDWEAVCVDDGSTDGTASILREMSHRDGRIAWFSQENMGLVKARKAGLRRVSGAYVVFVDADDTLIPTALERMVDAIRMHDGPDILFCGSRYVRESKVVKTVIPRIPPGTNRVELIKMILTRRLGWEFWGKAFRRDLFDHPLTEVPEVRLIGEDIVITAQLAYYAERAASLPEPLYNYVLHPKSVTHVKSVRYAEENLRAGFFVSRFFAGTELYAQLKPELDCMCLLLFSNSTRRGFLPANHPYIRQLKSDHVNFSSLRLTPFAKRCYLLFMLYVYLPLFVRRP